MQQYLKKPEVVEAIQWSPDLDLTEIFPVIKGNFVRTVINADFVHTIGNLLLTPGDWVVKYPGGHLKTYSDTDFHACFDSIPSKDKPEEY